MQDEPETRGQATRTELRLAAVAALLAATLGAPTLAQAQDPAQPDQGVEAPVEDSQSDGLQAQDRGVIDPDVFAPEHSDPEFGLDPEAGEQDGQSGGDALAGEAEPQEELGYDQIEDPQEALEKAFADLKSEDEAVWRRAQDHIAKAWEKSGSDSMDLLLKRGRTAMESENWTRAIQHLTDLVNLAPDFAEGWNARATAFYRNDDYGAALADIAEALKHEPRHFGALAGLGLILQEVGDEKKAVTAYRKALELNPHLDGPAAAVERLAPTVDGRDA